MSNYRRELVVCLALAALTLTAYGLVGRNDFIDLDDTVYVTKNEHVRQGMTADSLRWAWTTLDAGYWHPLTWMSLQLDATLFGLNAGGYHWTSLLWHTASVLLLFVVLRRMTGAVWRSALVAALFAVHPLHVESVAWAAERKDVLSTFFWILTLGLYAWHAERPGLGRYLLVALAFTLGLLAKPMLVTLPFVLLLLDYWPLQRLQREASSQLTLAGSADDPRADAPRTLTWLVVEKVPLVVLAVAASILTVQAQAKVGAVMQLGNIPISSRLANALVSYVQYLWQTLWPMGLSVFYPHPSFQRPLASWQVLAALLLLVVITLLVLREGRRRPYLPVGWLWFVGTLVPVIGLIQAGEQARADRFTYVPHMGLFILLVWGGADLTSRWPRPVLAVLSGGVLIALATCTFLQVRHWRDSKTLWEHALDVNPMNAKAHANLGSLLFNEGQLEEATAHMARSVELDPHVAERQSLLIVFLLKQNRVQEAAHHYGEAIRLRSRTAGAEFQRGMACLRQGEWNEAQEAFHSAAQYEPGTASALYQFGQAEGRRGDWREAGRYFEIAVTLEPQSAEYRFHLAQALHEQQRLPEAVLEYEQALQLAQSAGQDDLTQRIKDRLRQCRERSGP